MKICFIFYALFLLIVTNQINASTDKQIPKEPFCNQELLNSYALKGYSKPKVMVLEMCPGVSLSCCKKEDQLQIYGNWVVSKEVDRVRQNYQTLEKVYSDMLNVISKVQVKAEKVVKLQKLKKVGNCKLLAERIINYDVNSIMFEITNIIRQTSNFLQQTYSGFYCAVCNAEIHKYFDYNSKKLWLSERFCRDIVENSLPTLLYFHVHLVKLGNLVSEFLASCDARGLYNLATSPPANVLFKLDTAKIQDLQKCKSFRNEKNWFVYCKSTCENFSLTEFPDFFNGQIKSATNFVGWSKKRILEIEKEAFKKPLTGAAFKKRILAEKTSTPKKVKDIYTAAQGAKQKIDMFKIEFAIKGIDLSTIGGNTRIIQVMFDQVRAYINLQKAAKKGPAALQRAMAAAAVADGQAQAPRSLKFAFLSKIVYGLMILIV